MKQLRKANLRQWLWQNLSSPVNVGSTVCSRPLYAFAEIYKVELPKRLPTWAREFDLRCQQIEGTIKGATAYHILQETEKGANYAQ